MINVPQSVDTLLGKGTIRRRTNLSVYKIVFRPIPLNGSESWILTHLSKSNKQAIDMKYVTKIKGLTRRDEIRNELVKEELEMDSIFEIIETQQFKWFGYPLRMKEERQVKEI